MLLLTRAFVKGEEELDFIHSEHSKSFEIALASFHLDGFESLASNMQVTLLHLGVSIFDIEINLLPAITYPTHIPHLVGLKLILDVVWMNRIYLSDESLHNRQWILFMLLFSQAQIALVVDRPRVALVVDAINCVVGFEGFGNNS